MLFQYLRDKKIKKKEGGSEKGGGGENSPISPPLDPRLQLNGILRYVQLFHLPQLLKRYVDLYMFYLQMIKQHCGTSSFTKML